MGGEGIGLMSLVVAGASCLILVAAGCAGGGREAAAPVGAAAVSGVSSEGEGSPAVAAAGEVCPVTGDPLGSMGPPVPVTVGGETAYVCCEGCVEPQRRKMTAALAAKAGVSAPAAKTGQSVPFSVGDRATPYASAVESVPLAPTSADDGHNHVH